MGTAASGRRAKPLRSDGLHECKQCGQLLPIEEDFGSYVGIRGQVCLRYNLCRKCRAIRAREYNHKHREKFQAIKRAKYDPAKRKEQGLKQLFGISAEEYEDMLVQQGGICAICGKHETQRHNDGRIRSLSVDHDHATGLVRGLLCTNCNNGLGRFQDEPALLERAAEYLRVAVALEENRRRNDLGSRGAA